MYFHIILSPLSMRHYLCVSMPYGPFSGDTDFPFRAARPSSGEQPGALRSRAGTWNETGRKPFSFFTLNTAASGVHTKKETSSSPESRKLNKLTAWGPPQYSTIKIEINYKKREREILTKFVQGR